MRSRYKVATYINRRGRSFNAEIAESDGKFPLTRAIPIVARRLGVTRKTARELLVAAGPCEWHHTGLYAMATDYYDTTAIRVEEVAS